MSATSAVLLGLAVACTVFPALSAQAGDQMEGMIKHNQRLLKIVKRNVSRCNKAVKKAKAYHKKNIANFERKRKETQEYISVLSPNEKQALAQEYAPRVRDIVMELLGISVQFQKNCPKHGKKFSYVFMDFSLAMNPES